MTFRAKSTCSWPAAPLYTLVAALALLISMGCQGERPVASDRPTVDATESSLAAPPETAATQGGDQQGEPSAATNSSSPPVKPTAAKATVNDDRLLDKTFDDLKFDIEVGQRFTRDMLSPEIEEFLGKRIRIRGYILPTNQRKGLTSFVLVRDDQECCFGPGAALYDCIFVEMLPGRTTNFSVRPVAVEGRFTLKEIEGFDDVQLAIFHLDGELVE